MIIATQITANIISLILFRSMKVLRDLRDAVIVYSSLRPRGAVASCSA